MSSDILIKQLYAKSNNDEESDADLLRIAAMRLKHVEEALCFVGVICGQQESDYALQCADVAYTVYQFDPFTDYRMQKVTLQ